MSRKAFDRVDKDVVDAKAAVKRLLRKRRSLMEEVVKDLPPREAFDMRLGQLLHENPGWRSGGIEEHKYEDDDFISYETYIGDCDEFIAADIDGPSLQSFL